MCKHVDFDFVLNCLFVYSATSPVEQRRTGSYYGEVITFVLIRAFPNRTRVNTCVVVVTVVVVAVVYSSVYARSNYRGQVQKLL